MKKTIALTAILVVLALLAACGATALSNGSLSSESEQVSETDIGRYNWVLGMDASRETVTYIYAEKFAEELERLSEGQMVVEIYLDGTLGGDLALLESCNGNNVTFVVQTTAPQVNFLPELAVFDLPVAYADIEGVREAVDQPEFAAKIDEIYEKGGYKLMGLADQTFRVMSSNKNVLSMADFKGQKIRTMENNNHMAFWSAVGASPTPMAFGELYTGLQQGVVNGQENPYAVIASNKLYEVQDYIIQTNHLPHLLSMIMSLEEYNILNNEEKAVLAEAVSIAKEHARARASIFEAEKIEEIEASGTEIIEVSPELYAEIRTAAQPVYDMIAEKVGQDLVDAYLGN